MIFTMARCRRERHYQTLSHESRRMRFSFRYASALRIWEATEWNSWTMVDWDVVRDWGPRSTRSCDFSPCFRKKDTMIDQTSCCYSISLQPVKQHSMIPKTKTNTVRIIPSSDDSPGKMSTIPAASSQDRPKHLTLTSINTQVERDFHVHRRVRACR
jgi:hypothetical protein